MENISHLLRSLGAAGNYRCYLRTAAAIALVSEDENRLFRVISEVYAVVGAQYGCTWQAVEHSIRTTIGIAWRRNKAALVELAGYPMERPPTASEFIGIAVNHMQRSQQPVG